jgi:hypothetical protein
MSDPLPEPTHTNLPPIPMAFLICDQVISDEATKKKTLVGIFDRIWVAQFPTNHHPIAVYARFYDAEGTFEVRVEYVKVKSETVMAEAKMTMNVPQRKAAGEFSIAFPPIPIPEPGDYEFRLWINDRYVQKVGFTALQTPATAPK